MESTHFSNVEAYAPLFNRCGIFERWHYLTYADFKGGNSDIATVIAEYAEPEVHKEKGIIIRGTNGTGKSMLMNISFKKLIVKHKKTVFITTLDSIVKAYTNSWRGDNEVLENMKNCDYLGLDDLGKEFATSGTSIDLIVAALDLVLRHRFNRLKPTWITTNESLTEIKKVYGKSLASLIGRSCDSITLNGDDYSAQVHKNLDR